MTPPCTGSSSSSASQTSRPQSLSISWSTPPELVSASRSRSCSRSPTRTQDPRQPHPHQHSSYNSRSRHDSVVSVSTRNSARSHQEYLDSLIPPTKESMEKISTVQEAKEEEITQKRLSQELNEEERAKAAGLIQRNYRGHRERRQLAGLSLDPSTRWTEAIKEARYRNLTQPRPKLGQGSNSEAPSLNGSRPALASPSLSSGPGQSAARQNWRKIGTIARRAGGDEDSDSESEIEDGTPEDEREARKRRKAEEKMVRQKAAKLMDLQYFLEMVDVKHRYGSNLRTYHEEWKKADTNENFFYWLDYGEGRFIDCQGCPRDRLDREQVRYLSKEERLSYLVKFDTEGRLCWAKNGARIDTTEKWKDSIKGIVPDTDDTPPFAPISEEAASRSTSSVSSVASQQEGHHHHDHEAEAEAEAARADKYATPKLDNSKGIKKVKHVSAATIFNKLLRGSVKKNTWIFVADTSFRLYVGIKQSGAFQHSSFLHGSRISAAGLIKIKDGRLSKLSPLSGHYRPPVANFRAFVHSLKDNGVDMSHVSISRSYAVLVGLEAYVKTRRRGKTLVKKITHGRDKLIAPEEVAKKEEEERDKSESAALERRFLEVKQKADEEGDIRTSRTFLERLRLRPRTPKKESTSMKEQREKEAEIEEPGTGPENAIPPDGARSLTTAS
ncbi:IQ calmodulin-binding motif domain protein [Phlyctema vagabunda]|uniref:IQ calmodulin-binding motif domain protein n=1 Tax=Phlyctema vagabunda TaxID=108571 RepID=A0ABR4PGB9_9HELO